MGRFILNKKHFGARIVFARLVQGIFLYDFAFSISNNGHISLGNFDKINFFIYPVKGSLRHLSLFSAQGLLRQPLPLPVLLHGLPDMLHRINQKSAAPASRIANGLSGFRINHPNGHLDHLAGRKNSPFSPTSLLSAKTSKASPMTSLFDFNKLYLSN